MSKPSSPLHAPPAGATCPAEVLKKMNSFVYFKPLNFGVVPYTLMEYMCVCVHMNILGGLLHIHRIAM